MTTFLTLTFKNVRAQWRKSLFALLSIVFGFMSLALFQGYMHDVSRMYEDTNVQREMWGHLFIEPLPEASNALLSMDPEELSIDEATQKRVQHILEAEADVLVAARFLFLNGGISNGGSTLNFVGYGYDVEQGTRIRSKAWAWDVLAGIPLSESSSQDGFIMGQSLAHFLGCRSQEKVTYLNGLDGFKPENRPFVCENQNFQLSTLTKSGQANSAVVKPVGITDAIYQELDERFVAMPIKQAQALLNTTDVTRFSVLLKNPSKALPVLQRLNSRFQQEGLKLRALRWQDHADGDLYIRTMDLLTIFRNFVVSIILGIVGLSVFNTFVRNITERTRELGTFRSLGFTRSQVMTLILLETLALVVIGVLAGIVLSFVSEMAMNFLGLTYKPGVFSVPVPFRIAMTSQILLGSALFLAVISLISSFFAARSIVNKKVSECLVHT